MNSPDLIRRGFQFPHGEQRRAGAGNAGAAVILTDPDHDEANLKIPHRGSQSHAQADLVLQPTPPGVVSQSQPPHERPWTPTSYPCRRERPGTVPGPRYPVRHDVDTSRSLFTITRTGLQIIFFDHSTTPLQTLPEFKDWPLAHHRAGASSFDGAAPPPLPAEENLYPYHSIPDPTMIRLAHQDPVAEPLPYPAQSPPQPSLESSGIHTHPRCPEEQDRRILLS